MRTLRAIVASLIVLAASPAMADDIDVAEVDRRASQLIKQRGMVGLAVAVIDDGEIVFSKGYGRTEARGGEPVTSDTVFRWASVSKSVAAATALKVADEGHFGLPTPVERVVPIDLPNTVQPTTLEHVLSHQTGLTRNAFDRTIESNFSRTRTKTKLADARTVCQPGDCHTYQNVAFDLSADMIETALGVPYRAVVNARIFEPLGMQTASLSHQGLIESKSWAKPHNSGGSQYNNVKPTYYRVPGAAGVNSSVTDLAKWIVANMDGESEVLPETIRQSMQAPRTRTQRRQRQMRRKYPFLQNASYGLGWRLYDYEGGGNVVAHRGAVQGYRASAIFDPASQDGVVVLWNSNSSRPHGLAYEVMDQAYGKVRTDWLGLNRTKRRSTVRLAKAEPAKKPKLIKEAELPAEPAALTAADVEKLIAEENARLMAESLAATCPCPDDTVLSGGE